MNSQTVFMYNFSVQQSTRRIMMLMKIVSKNSHASNVTNTMNNNHLTIHKSRIEQSHRTAIKVLYGTVHKIIIIIYIIYIISDCTE